MKAVSLLLSAALTACSAKASTDNTMNVDENLTTTEMNATSTDTPTPKLHHYNDRDGTGYEYVTAVSEDDAKKGKAVGDVVVYAFRGVADGLYRISAVDDAGHTQLSYVCSNPCSVIKAYRQGQLFDRIPYDPQSVIGSAFDDAFNGFLEVSKEPRTFEPPSDPATPDYPSPVAPSGTVDSEGTDADNNSF